MSGKSTVDRAAMVKAAGQIQDKATAIAGVQSTLQGQVAGLIGSGWQGNAANAFLRAFDDFDGQFKNVKNALDEIHQKLTSTHVRYVSTEDQQTQASSAVLNALNG